MTVAELKQQIEWMPNDYELIVQIYDRQFDSDIKKEIVFEPLHDDRQILIYAQ